MSAQDTISLMHAYVEAIDQGALERLESLLAPSVVLHTPPHQIQFPGNVIARLRAERQAFPDLHLTIESAFADEGGTHGTAIVAWSGRRMPARLCMVFTVQDGHITGIEVYGGLARMLHDVGLVRVA